MDKEILKAFSNLLDEKLEPIKNDIGNMKSDISLIKIQQEEQSRNFFSLQMTVYSLQ